MIDAIVAATAKHLMTTSSELWNNACTQANDYDNGNGVCYESKICWLSIRKRKLCDCDNAVAAITYPFNVTRMNCEKIQKEFSIRFLVWFFRWTLAPWTFNFKPRHWSENICFVQYQTIYQYRGITGGDEYASIL